MHKNAPVDVPRVASANAPDDFDLPDLPTDAIEPLADPITGEVAVTREQVAARALYLWRQGSRDTFANWIRAEQEVTRVARRALELYRQGSTDAEANWLRASAEIDG